VVVLTGLLYRLKPGRGGGPARETVGGSGLLYLTGFGERSRGSNGGRTHLGEEGAAVGGRPGGGVRRLKTAEVLGWETVAWPSAGGRRRGSVRVGMNDWVGQSCVGLGWPAGQGRGRGKVAQEEGRGEGPGEGGGPEGGEEGVGLPGGEGG
jgi:hypothetical protein